MKTKKNEWRIYAIICPVIWFIILFSYISNDGCLSGRWGVMCGHQAILVIAATFVFFMYFPFAYFKIKVPEIKKEKTNENLNTSELRDKK
ncbi:hypothetical protein K2P97_13565 [bacterium]|nr:hypothetical protein [bacterium]